MLKMNSEKFSDHHKLLTSPKEIQQHCRKFHPMCTEINCMCCLLRSHPGSSDISFFLFLTVLLDYVVGSAGRGVFRVNKV